MEYLCFPLFCFATVSIISLVSCPIRSISQRIYCIPALCDACSSVRTPPEYMDEKYSLMEAYNFCSVLAFSSTAAAFSFSTFPLPDCNFSIISSTIFAQYITSFATSCNAAAGCAISLLSRYFGFSKATTPVSFPSGTSFITIFTIRGMSGIQISVIARLNPVCAFAICREITSISFPFGEIN